MQGTSHRLLADPLPRLKQIPSRLHYHSLLLYHLCMWMFLDDASCPSCQAPTNIFNDHALLCSWVPRFSFRHRLVKQTLATHVSSTWLSRITCVCPEMKDLSRVAVVNLLDSHTSPYMVDMVMTIAVWFFLWYLRPREARGMLHPLWPLLSRRSGKNTRWRVLVTASISCIICTSPTCFDSKWVSDLTLRFKAKFCFWRELYR